jgi:hypothetical protein
MLNEDTIGNEIVTSDQQVNAMQGTFSYADPGCTNLFYLFCKMNNRRLKLNDTVFFCHLSVLKGGEKLLQGRWTGGGHVFFAKYNFNYGILIFCFFLDIIPSSFEGKMSDS